MMNLLNYEPRDILHPKEMLLEYLEAKAWGQRDLAREAGLSIKTVSGLCSGKIGITTKTASALEVAFNRPAHFWLNLQRRFDQASTGKEFQTKVA